jgi:hypothetical protein
MAGDVVCSAGLDSALAAWMSKRRHGGRPVVLRRQAATPHLTPLSP